MEVVAELDEALKVVNIAISSIKWRLSASSWRRLQIDILALCTGLRPVVMVDYGGKLPELQTRLCHVLQLSQKDSSILADLRVMLIDEMIYLLHLKQLAHYVISSLNSEIGLYFVDLEQDPPKMINNAEQKSNAAGLVSIQRIFSVEFPIDGINTRNLPSPKKDNTDNEKCCIDEHTSSQFSNFIDLSSCMQDIPITIPTLNGWLLGYPVVYLFTKDHIEDAIYNLSTKSLRVYKILICRKGTSGKGTRQEELMSFSVPYDLSMGGENEPWAEAFLARIQTKLESCKQVWSELQMEVNECYPQAIAL